ncbi:MAG: hypothetical protein L6R40_007502 [Gallowayella cf. fulva]|nr:MAG: hypothetical protein L6R40_007502 [Xanthomendoza cf. fulva]
MASNSPSKPPATESTDPTQQYYDDAGTDKFYTLLWGGQDIHAGIYPSSSSPSHSPTDDITLASIATVAKMSDTLFTSGVQLGSTTRILDLGAGYGGAARYLARNYGCEVVCLNLSEVQNERNKAFNRQEGLEDRVSVYGGVFEDVPAAAGEDGGFDVIWSQDSFLHSRNRSQIVAEIDRLLRKDGEGRVVFTDIMASKDAFEQEPELMRHMLERLHLSSLGTRDFYISEFKERGFKDLGYWDGKDHFATHYRRLGEELDRRKEELLGEGVDPSVVERHTGGMKRWVEAKEKGCVDWGIHCFGR